MIKTIKTYYINTEPTEMRPYFSVGSIYHIKRRGIDQTGVITNFDEITFVAKLLKCNLNKLHYSRRYYSTRLNISTVVF